MKEGKSQKEEERERKKWRMEEEWKKEGETKMKSELSCEGRTRLRLEPTLSYSKTNERTFKHACLKMCVLVCVCVFTQGVHVYTYVEAA